MYSTTLSSSDETDEESTLLDVYSSQFDPLAVIYNPGLKKVPDPSAPILDNVDKFMSVYEKKRSQSSESKDAKLEPTTSYERQFKPEQMPIQGKGKKEGPNVWNFMDRVKGPLSILKRARENQQRIRVYTRGVNHLRGHLTAYLIAFDKHWNLALMDVDEVFRKKRFSKSPLALEGSEASEEHEEGVKRIKTSRRWIHCERHMEEATVLKSLFRQVSEARSKLKLLQVQMEETDSIPQVKKSKKNNGDESMDFKNNALVFSKETELLGNESIEELPGDDGVQYFLAIAEMQKNIQNLRELKQMGERILNDNEEHAKAIQSIVEKRDNMEQRIREEMEKSKSDKENENALQENDKEKQAVKELETQLRNTKEAYKHIKTEFGYFLLRICPKAMSPFGSLLQALWSAYVRSLNQGESGYIRISHLDFDVNQGDVNRLDSEGIIIIHPDDPDQIKLIRFQS